MKKNKQIQEQREALFRRLNDGGVPVQWDHFYKVAPVGLEISPIPGCNEIFELDAGGTGYQLELQLRNALERPIDIVEFRIATPWGVPNLSLVPPRKKSLGRQSTYDFSGYYSDRWGEERVVNRYHEGEYVLNYLFARQKSRLNPGGDVVGMLLLVDQAPIPNEYPDHGHIPVKLSIFDSRGNESSAPFNLHTDRPLLRARERAAKPPKVESSLPARVHPLLARFQEADRHWEETQKKEISPEELCAYLMMAVPMKNNEEAKADGKDNFECEVAV